MANNTPFGNNSLTSNLLPAFYQSKSNKKFLQATLDQLYQPGSVKKINGFIGRKNAKAATGADIYVTASDKNRQNYQLEPSVVIQDSLNNVTFYKDYIDYINQLGVFGGNTDNHSRLNSEEFYSWDPHIDWDKISNFQNYYWLPYGPESITVYGQQQKVTSTYTVDLVAVGEDNQYVFTPNGFTPNPVLKLYRGQTYTFEINSLGNAFSFKLARTTGPQDRYLNAGIDNYAVQQGTITWTIANDAPTMIYYQSETDINLGGVIEIYDIDQNTYIDVEADVLGKKNYKLTDGTPLSNGMKVKFGGNVTPVTYTSGSYYVEGVGTAIKLVPQSVLEIVSPYTLSQTVEFDNTPFDQEPFSDATGYAGVADYIVINRASRDHNPWSRYNRWFHKDVITASAKLNGDVPNLDQLARATRPIIEFEADLKLFNFGTTAIEDIDLIDNFTTDVFSTIEGSAGYNVDGIPLTANQTVLFTADTDPLVANKVYRVEFVDVKHLNTGSKQLHLVEIASPELNQTVLINQGVANQSLMYWFNGTTWIKSQQKTNTNQPPLFDVVDDNNISYGDTSFYPGSTFIGTKVFSYKVGLGLADKTLGFALSYKNVSNIGDIVFNFNLATDSFQYKQGTALITKNINVGYIVGQDYAGNTVYENGWQTSAVTNTQAALRIYENSNKTNNFNLDIFDDLSNLNDLVVRVYVNGIRLAPEYWNIVDGQLYKQIVLVTPIALTDVLTIRAFAAQPINSNGYYEIPINLQNNPLNNSMGDFTLGEISDHVNSIIDNIPQSSTNLRDLGNTAAYGTKFVQHSGPMSLSIYHITSESNNIVRAIEQSRDDYNHFKRIFITTAENLGIDGDPVKLVDVILEKINVNKPNTAPYYFSDMIPYGASVRTDITVVDYRIKTYPLSAVFTLDTLSSKAVGVYLNDVQLTYGRDYTFNDQGFVVIDNSLSFNNGDIITTLEYESTDGCFVPETPTKLGIYPKFEPKIYLDTTLVAPQLMIQGHDGSQILAYNDYRDGLILELEKRIFNNIKVEYDPDIYDINKVIPSYNKTNAYTREEFNKVLAPNFYRWAKDVGVNFSKPLSYDISNSFTYNYRNNSAPDGTSLPGYWRGVYRWLLNTDRPNICPWEMLGLSIEPSWWTSVYGPAPYTSDNRVMWKDISDGMLRAPGKPPVYLADYAKPFLIDHIPVDESGNLVSPLFSSLALGQVTPSIDFDFVFGDVAPVEASWRRSSHYPFSVLIASMLLTPANTFGVLLDRSRIVRNKAGQLIYKDTGLRVRPQDIVLPSTYSSSTRVQTAGIINYVVNLILNYIFSNNLKSYNGYASDLASMNIRLAYRVGSFTNQDQFNLLLESKTPSSTGSVFIPKEDYSVFLNSSSPTRKLAYSGIIITRLQDGFQVSGYSLTQPFFNYYGYSQPGSNINVGGISENFSNWTAHEQYAAGSIVKYNGSYFKALTLTTTGADFDSSQFVALPFLPITGGVTANFRKAWDKTQVLTAPYGATFKKIQDVVDFLLGYGEYLKDQGFIFNQYNTNLGVVSNWETSAKEFMFWTTQNWSTGQDKWSDWTPNIVVPYGTIVRYNGEYYSAVRNVPASDVFEYNNFNKLDGLSVAGASVISLSPAAGNIEFVTPLNVVDDINNSFNRYEIFKVNGTAINTKDLDSYRKNNTVTYTPKNKDGIYGASFYLVQHEHVVILNNSTIFNDTIYNPESGYRQERIKLSGYITSNWYGGLDIPGFIFDAAKIQSWQQWQDYNLGDIINYQGYYYSANEFLPGTATFDLTKWTELANKPSSQILPNWTNIATQFQDFYGLDVDSFDSAQQSMGQHLIGYQKRQYLDNIIQDDVSEFKFYQGMIREKGTQNVLNKLFNVLSSEDKESLVFYEEWAVRTGQYGAANSFQQIEFTLDEGLVRNNPQGYLLTNKIDTTLNPFIVQILPSDVYLPSNGYDSTPWPVLTNYKPLLTSAGYVNSKDVDLSIGHLSDIVSYDPTKYVDGNYVWCAFAPPPYYWNVYRYTLKYTAGVVSSVTSNTTVKPNTVTITVPTTVTFAVGDYIGIIGTAKINGFYAITAVTTNTFTFNLPASVVLAPFNDLSTIEVFYFVTQRSLNSSIDQLESLLPTTPVANQLVWTDYISSTNTNWASWIYNPVYNTTIITDQIASTNHNFGRALAMTNAGDTAAITSSDGQTAIYLKAGILTNWTRNQLIQAPAISTNYTTAGTQGTIESFNITGLSLTLSLISGGSGYRPANGSQVYANVPLTGGTGSGAVANITVFNGVVTTVQLVRYNTQYVSGQVLTADARYLGGTVNTPVEVQVSNTCGSGYTPSVGTTVYANVPLIYTTSGTGDGTAVATVTVTNGLVSNVLLNYGGLNYQVGDRLTVNSSSIGGTGTGFSVLVGSVNKNSRASVATTVAISNDKQWLAIGSPTSSFVATNYKGVYSTPNSTDYVANAIVTDGTHYYQTTGAMLHQYTGVTGVTQNQAQGARFNVVVIGSTYTVNVVSGGAGYKVGNKITILGSQVGGIDTVNDITVTVSAINGSTTILSPGAITGVTWSSVSTPSQTYTSLSGNVILGSGATFTVKPILPTSNSSYIVTVSATGSGYLAGDQVLIKGSAVGGVDIINDLLVTLPTPISGFVIGYQIVNPYGASAWNQIPYVPVDTSTTANNSSNTNQGVVSVYKRAFGNSYLLADSIVSPSIGFDPTHVTGEKFGSTLTFNTSELYVGAIGYNNNTGRVYKLAYTSNVIVSSAYNPIGSSYATLVVTSTTNITPGLIVQGTGFTSGQTVTAVINSTTLELSGSPDSTPAGILNFVTTGWHYSTTYTGTSSNSNFGSSIVVSTDSSTLAISASGGSVAGQVFVYKDTGNGFALSQTISDTLSRITFGASIALSDSADYLAISNLTASSSGVIIYPLLSNGQYDLVHTTGIHPRPSVSGTFGNKIAFMNGYTTLVVFSTVNSSGRIDIYDRYDTQWVYSETIPTTGHSTDALGAGFAVGVNQIFAGAPNTTENNFTNSGAIYNYYKLPNNYTWTIHTQQTPVADVKKIKKAFLYDKTSGSLLKYLDVVDPLQGKIPGPAEEEIRYKTFYDPAVYSIGTSDVVVNTASIWSNKQVGQLWWDLRTAKFINSYDQDVVYRNSTWNQLAAGASIDVYEWVSSTIKPSQWDAQADTNAGLASGISGTSLYGDSVYSTTQSYDKISKTFKNTYYFWVKNKVVIPYVNGRQMSAMDVANLIANPRGQDYTYLGITGLNTFSLTNVKGYLTSSNVILSVEFWTIDKTDQNIHTQYKMISNDPNINLPKIVEQKWFDSLCGIDSNGKVVPDPRLPFKIRYGIENRPRQSMFINRFEALKQLIEYANQVMITNQIAELNISSLESYDKEPTIGSGLYDAILDTDAELPYASVSSFSAPSLVPVITNGAITGIIINSAGKGFVSTINNVATSPYIEIIGSGTGAVVRATINALGQVTGATIISSGAGYDSNTRCSIRNYAVLVHSDSQASNQWSVYTYDPVYKQWSRTLTQSYDVRNYWSYADWFASGYNQFTVEDYAVNTFVDLNSITVKVGQIVRIRTSNNGGWILLEKYADVNSVDWTQSYNTIGIQNGTIQFSSKLYDFALTDVGYDSSIFDGEGFDVVAATELRIILKAIKNNIFIDSLKQEYLNLFFNSVHYVLSEQVYVDWIFKTSFVKAQHNVGALDQPVNYPVENLANFENYVSEVKPYRTKVREYVSNYESLDTAQLPITDFDVMPIYENDKVGLIDITVQNGKLVAGDSAIQTYPWKFWLDNVGFIVTELILIDGGSGYNIPPQVVFNSESGSGATGRAFINNGVVTRVVLLTPGSGYLAAPEIVLDGGLSTTGVQARAIAIIGESVVRSTTIGIKFDRVSQTNYVTQLQQQQTFLGDGSQLKFALTWAPDIRVGQSSITVNGIPVLRELYTLSTVVSTKNGYTQYSGLITFAVGNAPAKGTTLSVTYLINSAMLNAADRVEFYYEPGSGMLGKDLAQVMTGIDYGGTIVNGLGFNVQTGWGASPYYKDKWDNYDSSFDDYYVTVAANTHSFTLPYVPAANTQLNIYQIKNNVDSYDNRSGVYNNQLEFSYNINDSSPVATTITHINTAGHSTTYNPNGSYETTLVVANASGILPGMGIIGVGFSSNVAVLTTTGASGNGTTVTLTFDAVSTPPYSIGQTIIVNNVLPVAYSGTYTVTACTTTSVSYTSTATGVKTQSGTIIGSAIHKVVSVNQGTNTVTLSRAPDSIPSGTLIFTYNFSGSTQLTVADTTYINVGDVVACSTINSLIYNSTVTAIIDSQTVSINSILYTDIVPSVELTFTKTLETPADITINANGTAVLNSTTYPTGISDLTVLNITGKISPVRLDDPHYGTQQQTNKNAIMTTPVATGTPDSQVAPGLYQYTITIPNGYTVSNGDEFIIRRSTSDGSILPNANDYDTSLVGGDMAYSTATGLAADDIIVDGDGMVTPTTSPAPEEVVPGQVVDAVAIKVFDRSNSGAATIVTDNFIADGVTKTYTLSQQPNSPKALIVKVGNTIKTYQTDYTVDYKNKKVTLTSKPSANTIVTIFNIGFAGSNILDLDYFVGDATTTEFVTKAPWLKDITAVVYVDGVVANPQLFKTDGTYDFANAVGFKFTTPPAAGSLINFIIVSGSQQTFVVTNKEILATDGVSLTYSLAYPVGTSLPYESSMLVRVDQTILEGPNDNYFIIEDNQLSYNIDPAKIVPYSATIQNINVIANGVKLNLGSDYTVDLSGITITLTQNAYTLYMGTTLLVSITTDESYFYNASAQTITFTQAYNNTHVVEVISSYNHSVLDIRRSSVNVTSNVTLTPNTADYYYYKNLASGLIKLDRTIISDDYVWITKNGTLLTPTIDYKLNDDKQSVQLATLPNKTDQLTFITFGSNILASGIAYMQFKDMLNRVTYKRLSLEKRTTLAADLHWNDTSITLTDASNFDVPNPTANKPGVIEIRGERIEYFAKNGNIVSRLRRGTLGTGVYKLHKAGAFVQDIGPTETIPYTETTITEQIISDGTNSVNLSFAPALGSESDPTGVIAWFKTSGYTYQGTYNPLSSYSINSVVVYQNTYYVNILSYSASTSVTILPTDTKHWKIAPTAIPPGYGQCDNIEVFVGGYNDGSAWASGIEYSVGDIVNIGSYTYRCTTAHTSGATFNADSTNWTFFIGNIRLKKQPYKVHNVNVNPYSPAGDVTLDADFAVDGSSRQIRLTNLLNKGTHVTVIKQIGTAWDGDKNNPVNILNDNSKIAEFLKVSPGIWYTDYKS